MYAFNGRFAARAWFGLPVGAVIAFLFALGAGVFGMMVQIVVLRVLLFIIAAGGALFMLYFILLGERARFIAAITQTHADRRAAARVWERE